MKVLFCASECTPFVKTGGLADVIGSLPAALKKRRGVEARVIMPKYSLIAPTYRNSMVHLGEFNVDMGGQKLYCGIDSIEENGVIYYFVDNLALFGGDTVYTGDEGEGFKFAFFCRAVLNALPMIGYWPNVIHCHDWQTGILPVLLKEQYSFDKRYAAIKTVYTIHNLRYQGLFDYDRINPYLGLRDECFTMDALEFYGLVSFMKGGILYSDRVTTVSPTYADEIMTAYYGERLDGLLRSRSDIVSGILNGIDTEAFDPERDPYLKVSYSRENLRGKAEQKRALQEECGLRQDPEPMLIGMVARLCSQKGLDLIECVLDDIMRQNVQMVFLGKGDAYYEYFLMTAEKKYPGRIAVCIDQNEALAHKVYAGSDMFLMPSQFEPCGLSQLIAMRYGTIPLVRETGGLKDTVIPFNVYTDEGNGFSFAPYNAHEMLYAIERACNYRKDKALWGRLVDRAMRSDYSWVRSAKEYVKLYRGIK